jgi:hypothetical protein
VLAGIFLHLSYCRPPENLTATMVTASCPEHKTYINHVAYILYNAPTATEVSMKTYHIDGNRILSFFSEILNPGEGKEYYNVRELKEGLHISD